MIHIMNDITGVSYVLLLDYLKEHCDSFTFVLPNYGKRMVTPENQELYDGEHEIGYIEEEDQDDFRAYKNAAKTKIKKMQNDIIDVYCSTAYLGNPYEYEFEIYNIRLNDRTLKVLKEEKGMCSWQYPLLPEDLCFFKGDRCYFWSVSHERMYFIYDDTKEAKKALKKLECRIREMPDDEIPLLR